MTTLALLLAVIILVTRLPLLLRDRPIRLWEITLCLTFQILLSFLVMEGFPARVMQWSSLLVTYSLLGLGWWWLEREKEPQTAADKETKAPEAAPAAPQVPNHDPLEGRRLVLRLASSLLLILLATWLGSPWTGTGVRPQWDWLLDHEAWFSPIGFLAKAPWRVLLITAFGLLLCLNEVSTFVRLALTVLKVKPSVSVNGSNGESEQPAEGTSEARNADPDPTLDEDELQRGRWIGILERVIVFALILVGQYGVLGFVLTAKTMARFKSLDKRPFAEYFILGTLLSVVLGGGVALSVRKACGF